MTAPRVKICGLTRPEDVRMVAEADVDWIGLNHWPKSKRFVAEMDAVGLAAVAHDAGIEVVGLFVDATADEVVRVAHAVDVDVIQLHGDESPAVCAEIAQRTGLPVWKAVPVATAADVAPAALARWSTAALLLDAATAGRGGSGQTIDWALAAEAVRGRQPIVLAGGLTADNVAAAIAAVQPWAVDVASGVESAPGIKDPARVAAFVAAARARAKGRGGAP